MRTFNKYTFIDNLKEELTTEAAGMFRAEIDESEAVDNLHEFIATELDNAVIYYADAFNIITELQFTDWSDSDFGPITNVSEAAYAALNDLIGEEINTMEIAQSVGY